MATPEEQTASMIANMPEKTGKSLGEWLAIVAQSGLLPIHDAIVVFAKSLGSDVELAPKKTSHSLRRKKQFALITPATKTRVDLGLALKGDEPHGRLEPGDAMCSHRVRLESVADFDAEVQGWIAQAYASSG
jgi:hypothetical protein